MIKAIFLTCLLLHIAGFATVINADEILKCNDVKDCCTKNWDLAKLDIDECIKFCDNISMNTLNDNKMCTIHTTKLDYLEYLQENNVRTMPDGTVQIVGYTEHQRDCIRYFEKQKYGTAWGNIKCCLDGSCTEFPDNYKKELKNPTLRVRG